MIFSGGTEGISSINCVNHRKVQVQYSDIYLFQYVFLVICNNLVGCFFKEKNDKQTRICFTVYVHIKEGRFSSRDEVFI